MFDDADYSIYGVCFYFLPNSRIRIGYGNASIEGYFPWERQADRNVSAWMIISMLEMTGIRSLATFKMEWGDILGAETAEEIYEQASEIRRRFPELGLPRDVISNCRRVASTEMMKRKKPRTRVPEPKQSNRGKFHTARNYH